MFYSDFLNKKSGFSSLGRTSSNQKISRFSSSEATLYTVSESTSDGPTADTEGVVVSCLTRLIRRLRSLSISVNSWLFCLVEWAILNFLVFKTFSRRQTSRSRDQLKYITKLFKLGCLELSLSSLFVSFNESVNSRNRYDDGYGPLQYFNSLTLMEFWYSTWLLWGCDYLTFTKLI